MTRPLNGAAHARQDIRPKGREPRSAIAIIGWTAFCVLSVLASPGPMRIIAVALAAGGVAGTMLLVNRWRHRALLALSGDSLNYTGLFRSRVVALRPVSGRAVTATVQWPGSGLSSRRWLLLDAAGRAQLALDLTAWDADELHTLADRLGIPQDEDATPRGPAELRRTYPGSVHWAAAHPYWLTLILIAALSIVMVPLGAG